jgi:hypothetical protein
MSFDSMKRSNNRHNFIAKKDYGELPSQSPFAAEVAKQKKEATTTAVKWKDVDADTRVSTAKMELRQKLSQRHSTTHQKVEKGHEPGTVGNPEKGLHVVIKSEAGGEDAADKSETKSTRSKSKKNNEGGGTFNFNGEESSDEEEDVYGWRFDAEGEEENDKNLQYDPRAGDGRSPVTVVTEDNDGTMVGQARASLNRSMRSFSGVISKQFEPKDTDHPVLAHAKSFSQFAGKSIMKAGSFAAKSAVKISTKLMEDVGEYMSRDEADQLGALVERNGSHMIIHDLANSPSKARFKKQREQDLQAAVAEMRQFGEEREHLEAERAIKKALKEKSLVQGAEALLHGAVFPRPKTPPPPDMKVKEKVKKDELNLGENDLRFTPGEGDYKDVPRAVPEMEYKTLLDVKDVRHYQEALAKKTLPIHDARQIYHENRNTVPLGQECNELDQEVNSVVSTKSKSSALQPVLKPASSFKLKRPPSLQLGAAARLRPTLKKGVSFSGRMEQAGVDWEMGKGPGAGLPPLRASTFRAPPPELPTADDRTPVYIKKLRQTGSFLKEQFSKAKVHLTQKLPRMESAPHLRLETGKERIPPKPTETNGFVGSVDLAHAALFGDDEEAKSGTEVEHEAELEQSKAPFSLLSSGMRATSFITGLRLTSTGSKQSLTSASGRERAPFYEGNAKLSERHKSQMIEASPGVSTPVIYAPQTSRTEATEESLYSHVTSITNMLEVSDGKKESMFKPGSMKHLDLSRVAEVPEHEPTDMAAPARIKEAADVGPDLPEKEIGQGWRACWDFNAESVYYFHPESGEASWLPPEGLVTPAVDAADEDDEKDQENFYRIMNNGLPRGLSEMNLGESDLTIKTRKIAARHNLFSKLRSRYEGDVETEYTKDLMAKEYEKHAQAEESEILKDLTKELSGWDGGSDDEGI